MTIAIGILCSDGIVIAADTQETAQNFMKTDVHKIRWADSRTAQGTKRGGMVITGAGRSGYIDAISAELAEWFMDNPDVDLEAVRGEFQSRLTRFYAQHVLPFQGDRPDFSLMIGLQRAGEELLLSSDLSSLRTHDWAASIGAGEVFASTLLNAYCDPWVRTNAPIESVVKIAAYIIYRVKEVIDTCGNHTQIVFLRNGSVEWVYGYGVTEWERVFAMFDNVTSHMLHSVVAQASSEKPMFDTVLEMLRSDCAKFPISSTGGK